MIKETDVICRHQVGEDSAVVTSRDGYNRNRPTRGSSPAPRESQRQEASWELDAEELDRYMSGQPAKEPRFDPYGRSQSSGRTERMAAPRQQPQRQQPQYDDYEDQAPAAQEQWVEDEYADDFAYDDYPDDPMPEPISRPRRQQRQPMRQRQMDPEYDDDLYDDPYVLDEEDAPRRPSRRKQPRPGGRERAPRQAPNFSVPPAIAEAPIVKDQISLVMLGTGFVSLVVMLIVVMTQRDGLTDIIFTHVNANGEPVNLQTSDAIWDLPLIAGMVLLISGILAWFLARWGEFLPRFLLGGSIGVHFVTWVAVIAYLF